MSRKIPSAQAVAGVKSRRGRRWFWRESVVLSSHTPMRVDECACCRHTLGESRTIYCPGCVRHQRIHLGAMFLLGGACLLIGREAGDLVFARLPFAARWLHLALVFAICLALPLLIQVVMSLVPSEPEHGHWGVAVETRLDAVGRYHARFRNPGHARRLAEQLGISSLRERREPRIGWTSLVILCVMIPTLFAGISFFHFEKRFFTLFVDNGTGQALTLAVEGGETLGTAGSGTATTFRLPRVAMSVVARSSAGETVDHLSVGGLDEILAGQYEDLFPDIEHDVTDHFIWNVARAHCYSEAVKTYGIGFGSTPARTHNKKAFVSQTTRPFQKVPDSIQSPMGMGARREIMRAPCK